VIIAVVFGLLVAGVLALAAWSDRRDRHQGRQVRPLTHRGIRNAVRAQKADLKRRVRARS
jgi:hypothetical protein